MVEENGTDGEEEEWGNRKSLLAMAFYADEAEVWKCSDHPSKRRRIGVCPACLRDRLAKLCPVCANVRPCSCGATASSSSSSYSSSYSSSFSRFFVDSNGVGSTGGVLNLVDVEPAFRRSRSLSIPFLRSRSSFSANMNAESMIPMKSESFWAIFKSQKNKTAVTDEAGGRELRKRAENAEADESSRTTATMMRSRSVAVSETISRPAKGRVWPFPSPMKALRQSRLPKVVVQVKSPQRRG